MHEISLVRSLLSQVQTLVTDNNADSAEKIVVDIGPLSGVEIELVKSAFVQLAGENGQPGAELIVHEVPLVVRCRDCDLESELSNFVFRCHKCNSGSVQVIRGDEFRLVSVTLNTSDIYV
jgi:hydrogenase nickel incorporation protein HypA/HybF